MYKKGLRSHAIEVLCQKTWRIITRLIRPVYVRFPAVELLVRACLMWDTNCVSSVHMTVYVFWLPRVTVYLRANRIIYVLGNRQQQQQQARILCMSRIWGENEIKDIRKEEVLWHKAILAKWKVMTNPNVSHRKSDYTVWIIL